MSSHREEMGFCQQDARLERLYSSCSLGFSGSFLIVSESRPIQDWRKNELESPFLPLGLKPFYLSGAK
jgi:hypothetical protein